MMLPIRPRGDRALSVTARSEMRPLITAGPIDRKTSERTRTESAGSALSAARVEAGLDAVPRAGPVGTLACALATEVTTASARPAANTVLV